MLVGVGIVVTSIPSIIKKRQLSLSAITPPLTLVDTGVVPWDSLPLDSCRAMAALAEVIDPELDLSIVELGLVHELAVDASRNIRAVLVLTTPECPFSSQLAEEATGRLRLIPGAVRVELKLDPTIPWDPARLSAEGKARFRRLFGNDTSSSR